jgi:hypothetical protein
MQELPHGLPLTQFGFFVSADPPLADWDPKELSVYGHALEVLPRERVPLDWATTQNNLGIAAAMFCARRYSGDLCGLPAFDDQQGDGLRYAQPGWPRP